MVNQCRTVCRFVRLLFTWRIGDSVVPVQVCSRRGAVQGRRLTIKSTGKKGNEKAAKERGGHNTELFRAVPTVPTRLPTRLNDDNEAAFVVLMAQHG